MRPVYRPRSESHRPMRAAGLRKGRRYGIPYAAVERATERRLAGDWRGACAAAGVDADIDPDALRHEHGTGFTDRLLDDLHHLVPDLARLHMPRFWNGTGTLVPQQPVLLSRPGGPEGPWLTLRTRGWKVHGDQRPLLTVEEVPLGEFLPRSNRVPYAAHWAGAAHLWATSRHLWDARHVHEMRERWGGGPDRAPFLDPDGTPRTVDGLPTADPGPDDPAARTEWIDTLHQAGKAVEAFAAAGIDLDLTPVDMDWGEPVDPLETAVQLPFSPARLAAEGRRLASAGFGTRFRIPFTIHESVVLDLEKDVPRLGIEEYLLWESEEPPVLPEVCWTRPPDIDVLRDGMSPDELHPLVREALAPARPPADRPRTLPALGPARVRCRDGEWHTVTPTARGLDIPHTAEELEREAALRALGGASGGCFTARDAWSTGRGRLPRALRVPRDDLFERVRHGDTDAVLRHLDGGGDPNLRDRHGRSLLHHLAMVDHETALPLLLAAGADVNAADTEGRTPLYFAVTGSGTVELARALLDAGARTEDIGDDDLDGAIDRRSAEDAEEEGITKQDWESLPEEL
ncbi:ankyrin repeat domain-containing protein [Nocardiopsis dassonvillei]|uniref:ankyrin repeat domain-containing protein n=1 Tax=Nocardiopsis dassonvillei TaxID=2014 RepID=UPI003F55203D